MPSGVGRRPGEDAAGCAGAAFAVLAAGSWGEGSGQERGSRREVQGQRRREDTLPVGRAAVEEEMENIRSEPGGVQQVQKAETAPQLPEGRGCVDRSLAF